MQPKMLIALWTMSSIWGWKLNLGSNKIPRWTNVTTLDSGARFIEYDVERGVLRQKDINLHFPTFKLIQFKLHQAWRQSRSFRSRSFGQERVLKIIISSAYFSTLEFLMTDGRSFIYIRNKSGRSWLPCGKPDVTLKQAENDELKDTRCVLAERYLILKRTKNSTKISTTKVGIQKSYVYFEIKRREFTKSLCLLAILCYT